MTDILLGLLLLVGVQVAVVAVVLLVRGWKPPRKTCCGDPLPDCFPTESGTLPAGFQEQEEDFPWNLHGGDEVYWNDPDGGACSRFIVIRSIEFQGEKGDPDCIIRISGADGDCLECFAKELS